MPLVIVVVIGFFLWQVWPLVVAVAGIAAAVTVWRVAAGYLDSASRARRVQQETIIARADRQHRQVITGEIDRGTYGEYPPAQLELPSAVVLDAVPAPRRNLRMESVTAWCAVDVDFIGAIFRYTEADGRTRTAPFPARRDPDLDDLARLLASVRGWSTAGGQSLWWKLTFDQAATADPTFGVEVPNSLTLELAERNPRTEFDSYIALRGDGALWGYARARGREEESLSHVCVQLKGLRFLHDTVRGGLADAAEKGYCGDAEAMLIRVIYRKTGCNEFEIRIPCRFDKPTGWTPDWAFESP